MPPKIHWEIKSPNFVTLSYKQTWMTAASLQSPKRGLYNMPPHVCQASAQPLPLKHDEHMQWVVTEKVILQRTTSWLPAIWLL